MRAIAHFPLLAYMSLIWFISRCVQVEALVGKRKRFFGYLKKTHEEGGFWLNCVQLTRQVGVMGLGYNTPFFFVRLEPRPELVRCIRSPLVVSRLGMCGVKGWQQV